ncbi:Gfo/Idh/MocA family protein [Cohnella herbarum]|uniref:Gfo/Idh/MocA family oxidoreductase n=1 Tax=Cohnella herbarum TaxID=2728023 RepID=A0A7Z2VP41_9BACL|nr:Gfo/Idh/MocA family oxidoreductase [Cohnella herbarum]QJD86898.1 Gfo/Idh/MocA family oxidoreductase [Cohnella herbarum]
MSEKELRVAVIGAGAIAGNHFEAIQATAGLRACAVADIDQDRADELAGRYGINSYQDYRELIERERPDVVAIALPHYLHKEAAIFAAGFGCHLMLEKPMALSVSECDEIIRAAVAANIRMLIGHTQHYMADNLHAKRILRSGDLGRLVMIHDVRHMNYYRPSRPDWFLEKAKSGGGVLANLGTHSIDKIQWLTGSAVRKVNASISHYGNRGDVEGGGMVYLELANGVPATVVQSGYIGAARNETEIICTKGMLKLITGDSLWISRGGPYERLEVPETATPFELQYADLLEAIRTGSESGCPASYGREVIAVLEAVYRSAASGTVQLVL